MEITTSARMPEVLGPGAGEHLSFLADDAYVKARGADGALSVVEFTADHGFGPPAHRHRFEDELFVVLEGEMDFFTGESRVEAGPGAHAVLPCGIPHTFQVVSAQARFVCVTARLDGHPRFDSMIRTAAEAGDALDDQLLREICDEHDIEHLGRRPAMPVRTTTSLRELVLRGDG